MSKTMICKCEDVLKSEIVDAIEAGAHDIESLKRYTGFGTGVCQGKSCLRHVADTLLKHTEVGLDTIAPFTARPPVSPIPMRLLAAEDET